MREKVVYMSMVVGISQMNNKYVMEKVVGGIHGRGLNGDGYFLFFFFFIFEF
jgi:hypothetical protein